MQAPLTLERVVAKYRRDVHRLAAAAPADALTSLEGHLNLSLPSGLRRFLAKHNGATLFRGALRIRSTSEISRASASARRVALFADGQGDEVWAWAEDTSGHSAFGLWDGEQLTPYHSTFDGWLAAQISLLDTRVAHPRDRASLRFEADPEDLYQLIRAGTQQLRDGRPEEATQLLTQATQLAPWEVEAWQRLGDALTASDRSAARRAWLTAFRQTRLPLPWPGSGCLDPEVLRPMSLAFTDEEDWEQELRHFLEGQVHDAWSQQEVDVVVAVAETLAKSLLRRGHRVDARDVLSDLLSRCRVFEHPSTPWSTLLKLARLEVDLGHHDEAEALLRRLRNEGPDSLQAQGNLVLGRIAVTRQEPWAEEILAEAYRGPLSDEQHVELALLRVERAIRRNEQLEEARTYLQQATERSRRIGHKGLLASVGLRQGDVLRLENRLEDARKSYSRSLDQLTERENPELRYRIHLRLGDLALAAGRIAQAAESYRIAADGFASNDLPVREGWALLRLARLTENPADLLNVAQEQFSEADLAAGMAATDAIAGNPGRSLAWHLDRSAAQARARYNAQRSRPPWTRADADRPERRLGAHRLAIAACSERVVEAIAREMEACARAIGAGRTRAADPPVLRYIAAVDLISGHRSFRAAQVLLEHLLNQRVEGPAQRALQGAMCRSPNAALVDGLLSTVERPEQYRGHAVASAAELLGLRKEAEAIAALTELARPGANPIGRKAAVTALGRLGDPRAVEVLLTALDEPTLAEQAALSLLLLGDRRGVDFHGRALSEQRLDLSGHPGEIVGRYGGPSYMLLLVNASEGNDDRALGALQGLGLNGDPRAVPALLDGLSSRARNVVEVAAGALQILTGHREELDQPGFKHRWHDWWETHRADFSDGIRYRDGRIFDAGLLIEKMNHPDAWARRTAYDELVITTGVDLPFDADGPWRIQQAHLKAWRGWWREHKAEQRPGGWYLNGQRIS